MQCNRRRSESSRVDGFVAGVIRDALGVGIDVSHQLVAGDGLLLQQIQGDLVQQAAMLPQQLLGAFNSSRCSSFWTSSSAAAAVVSAQLR